MIKPILGLKKRRDDDKPDSVNVVIHLGALSPKRSSDLSKPSTAGTSVGF